MSVNNVLNFLAGGVFGKFAVDMGEKLREESENLFNPIKSPIFDKAAEFGQQFRENLIDNAETSFNDNPVVTILSPGSEVVAPSLIDTFEDLFGADK